MGRAQTPRRAGFPLRGDRCREKCARYARPWRVPAQPVRGEFAPAKRWRFRRAVREKQGNARRHFRRNDGHRDGGRRFGRLLLVRQVPQRESRHGGEHRGGHHPLPGKRCGSPLARLHGAVPRSPRAIATNSSASPSVMPQRAAIAGASSPRPGKHHRLYIFGGSGERFDGGSAGAGSAAADCSRRCNRSRICCS